MTAPRLLIVVNSAWFLVSHRLVIARAARAAGFDVHLAAGDAGDARDRAAIATIRAEGFPFRALQLSRAGRNPLSELRTYTELATLYRALRPDIVHHVTMKSVVYGTMAARRTGVPAVLNAVAGLGSVFLDPTYAGQVLRALVVQVYRRVVRHGRMIMLFQNPDDADAFAALQLVGGAESALIRGSGVDLSQFAPAAEPEGPPVVMFPARLLRDKGVHEFVDASRRIRQAGVHARFVLVGAIDDNPTSVSQSMLDAWVREGTIEHWGYRTDMPAVLAQASIVCLPSYREGMPKALLEAAACGKPIVTTDVPGCRDCVTSDTGLLVPVRDAIALAAALHSLLGDADRRRRLGEAARALAVQSFGVEAVIEETLTLYRRLLGRANPSAGAAAAHTGLDRTRSDAATTPASNLS